MTLMKKVTAVAATCLTLSLCKCSSLWEPWLNERLQLSVETSGTTNALLGVWGSDANNLWVVGEKGTILHWDGSVWMASASPTKAKLNGIWGSAAADIWAVGDAGTILHYDGVSWNDRSVMGDDLHGAWGLAGTGNVWTVGGTFSSQSVLRLNESSWTSVATPLETKMNPLFGIFGTDASNIWAVGDKGTILHWDGTSWLSQTSQTTRHLKSVWASSTANIWAVGEATILLKEGRSDWSVNDAPSGSSLRGVWAFDESQIWAVGDDGMLLHRINGAWHALVTGTTQVIRAVWGSGPDNLWAVGDSGLILRLRH